jgi:hypothetical protein
MKKLAAFLTAVMLFTLLAAPAMAVPIYDSLGRYLGDTDDGDINPTVETINPLDPMPDPTAEESPDVVIVDEETPLAEGGDVQQEGDVTVDRPRTEPGTYVRYNDPVEGLVYIPEDEVPLAETVPAGDDYIHTNYPPPESGVGVIAEITGDVLSSAINGVDVLTQGIEIDARSAWKSPKYNEVIFRQDAITEIAATGLPLVITVDLGVLTFDAKMVQTIHNAGEDVQLVVFQLEESSTSVLREDIGAFVTYELRLLKNGEPVPFDGGTIKVTIPFEYDYDKAYVGYVVDGEVVEEYDLDIDKENKTASWDCSHFSTWVIYQNSAVTEAPSEAPAFNIWMIISIILCAALLISWIVLGKRKKNEAQA